MFRPKPSPGKVIRWPACGPGWNCGTRFGSAAAAAASARGGGRPGALAVASPSGARSRKQGFTLPGAATQTHRPGPPPPACGARSGTRRQPQNRDFQNVSKRNCKSARKKLSAAWVRYRISKESGGNSKFAPVELKTCATTHNTGSQRTLVCRSGQTRNKPLTRDY